MSWVIGSVFGIAGIVQLLGGRIVWAVVLFVAAAFFGPFGYAVARRT